MINKPKVKTKMFISIFTLLVFGICPAQTLSTKETKVVFVVDSESEIVTHITLFTKMQKMEKDRLLERYTGCKFYVGLLKGSYEINNDVIVPKENTTLIMYTDKQIFPQQHFLPADDLLPGDRFNLGKTRVKVVSSKKGELVLRT